MSSMGSQNQQTTHEPHLPQSVTITHPHHPYYNRIVEVVRIRRGEMNDIIVKFPDGSCSAIAIADTDYEDRSDRQAESMLPILDLAGLDRIVKIVEAKMGRREVAAKEV